MAAPWSTAQAPAYAHSYPGGSAPGQHGYPSPYDQSAYAYQQGYSYPGYDPATYYQQYQQYPQAAAAGTAAPPASAAEEQPPLPPDEPPADGDAAVPAPAPAASTAPTITPPMPAQASATADATAQSPSAYYFNPYQQAQQPHGSYGYAGAYAPHAGYNPYQQHAHASHPQWASYSGAQAWTHTAQQQQQQQQQQQLAPVPAAAPPKSPHPSSQDPLAIPSNGASPSSDYRTVPPPGSLAGSHPKARESKAAPGTNVAFTIKAAKPIASPSGASSWSGGASFSSGSNQVPLGSKQPAYLSVAKPPAYTSVAPASSSGLAGTASATSTAPKLASAAPAAAPPAAAAGGGVPASLQQYVQRCLALTANDRERNTMREELIRVARDARANGTMWTTAWDREPPPALGGAARPAAKPELKRGRGQDYDSDRDSDDSGRSSGRRGSPQPYRRPAAAAPAWRGGKAFQAGKGGKGAAKGAGKEPGSLDRALGGGKWSAAERAKRAKRMDRFDDDEGPKGGGRYNGFSDRFAYQQHRRALIEEAADEGAVNWADFVVKGTSTKLEKSYFRLTSAPNPADVRPPAVLRQALQRLVGMIAAGDSNYFYYNDQFKALRQDCTVQQVRDELAVQVYEAHGRAALEYGDHSEYNQCQTQLAQLYADGQPGAAAEFAAYKVLYQAVHARHGEVKALMGTMRAALGDEVGKVSDSPAVLHALKVRAAVAASDWNNFFLLYAAAPNLGQALMDLYVPRVRFLAVNTLARAFRPSLPLSYLSRALGFQAPAGSGDAAMEPEPSRGAVPPGRSKRGFKGRYVGHSSSEEALQACLQWAWACKAVIDGQAPIGPQQSAVLSSADMMLNCKDSVAKLEMPTDTEKVAHGDANLAIEDFLAKL